jgi:hypothetical protein
VVVGRSGFMWRGRPRPRKAENEGMGFPRVFLPAQAIAGEGARSTKSPKKEKANLISQTGLYLCRQRPTLPHTFACSNIGPAGLNFRVRDGNGWIPRGKITDKAKQLLAIGF